MEKASEPTPDSSLHAIGKIHAATLSTVLPIFEGSAVGLIILDSTFHVVWVNEAISQAFGLPRSEIIGSDKRRIVKEKLKFIFTDPDAFAARVLASYDSNDHVEEFECHILPGPHRTDRWVQHWSQPIVSGAYAGGRVEYYTDITERKAAEAAVQKEKALLEGLSDSMPDGILIVSEDGKFLYYNQRFLEIWNFPQRILQSGADDVALEWAAHQTVDPVDFLARARKIYTQRDHAFREEIRFKDGRTYERYGAAIQQHGNYHGWLWTFRDISQRKRAENALAERERRFKAVFNQQFQFMALLSPEGIVQEINSLPLNSTGITREQVIGKHFWDTPFWQSLPEMQRAWPVRLQAAALADQPITGEDSYQSADGSLRHADAAVTAVKDASGKVDFFIIQASDTTERKKAERELRQSESKHQFLNSFNEGIRNLVDPRAIMLNATAILGRHLGVSRCAYADVEKNGENFTIHQDYTNGCASSSGKYQLSLFGPRAMEKMHGGVSLIIRNVDDELASEGGAETFNALEIKAIICCPLLKEGQLRAMMAVHQSAPRNWSAEEIGLVQFAVDRCWETIERARTEEALRESEEQNRLLMEHVKDFAIFSTDLQGRGRSWNPGAESIFGYSSDEAIGADLDVIFTPEDRAAGAADHERQTAIQEGYAKDERWHMRKNGQRFFATGATRPIFDAAGKLRGFIKVARDITERKQMEDELRDARENLERMVRERTMQLQSKIGELEAFSYSVSHDLRAPLRAMQGYSEFLLEDYGDKIDGAGKNYITRILNAAQRLDHLVQDILTYSRVASATVESEPVDLDNLIHDVIHGYPTLQDERVQIEIQTPLLRVMGHEGSLTQCISNLLANAVKFVPPDRQPQIRIWTEDKNEFVRLYFRDNGIGIAPADQSRIFGMFEKVDPAGGYEGTGIGLAIVRKAVERMQGRVGLQSEPGHGSTFWIELAKAV